MVFIHSKRTFSLSKASEKRIINDIERKRYTFNLDNISRTNAYFDFYQEHPDIQWAFLAHMVSRNAGWNMCDLEGQWLPHIMDVRKRNRYFLTYERANWLIFQDAYPQLLLYQYSTKIGRPMFHLLKNFRASLFMEKEWNRYWLTKDKKRLMTALIINEQNVIQKPVIEHPLYRNKVFLSPLFFIQDLLHFSCVLFPTLSGQLYGASVHGFRSVYKRITLGKRLADILFLQELYPLFYEFAWRTPHTGSRDDYEQYASFDKKMTTPFLRMTFPVIDHHVHDLKDWSKIKKGKAKRFWETVQYDSPILLTSWYKKKQKQLQTLIHLKGKILCVGNKKIK